MMLVIYNLVKHLKGISIGYYEPIIYFSFQNNFRKVMCQRCFQEAKARPF